MVTHSFTRRLIFCWFWSFRIWICSCHCLDSAANWSFNSVSFLRCSASSWASRSLFGWDDRQVSKGDGGREQTNSSHVGVRIGKCVTVCVCVCVSWKYRSTKKNILVQYMEVLSTQSYRIFSNLIRTSFCRFRKRKESQFAVPIRTFPSTSFRSRAWLYGCM